MQRKGTTVYSDGDHGSRSNLRRTARQMRSHIHCASLSSLAMVPVMPRPISAALRANSDLAPLLAPFASPLGDPDPSLRCFSDSNDCRCPPTFPIACRFSICARIERNSLVRSCIDVIVIMSCEQIQRTLKNLQSSGKSVGRCL